MNKIFLTLISLFFIVTNTFADKVEFTASSPKVVAVGEQFRLTFSFNAKGTAFKAPDLRDFNILSGPNTSSSSSIQIINGNMTRSVSYTYTYILSAAKQGKFAISSAQIKYKGKVYESNSISIEVVKGSAKAQNANRGYNQGRSNQIQKSNIPASEIKKFALQSIKNNEAMYFSCDVGKQLNKDAGLLSIDNYDYSALYNINFGMNKKERILSRQSGSSHGMALVGVDVDENDNPTKWLIENSWGAKAAYNGYLTATDKWFDEYMFRVVVDKRFVDAKTLKILKQKPTLLPPWDPMFTPDN